MTGRTAVRRAINAASVLIALFSVALPAQAGTPGEPGSPEAATLPEVVMQCAQGQTDINFAPVDELRESLGVDTPTAERVIAIRPYLAPSDLLVVNGIGPERLRAMLAAGNLCATPPTVPPPSAEACVDGAVDLQAASVAALAKRLGISRPAAERLAAARPFATMRHVTPERVPGVGKGTLDVIVQKSCLTPAPVRDAKTSWRWAYRSQTTIVTRGDFKLRIPGGVVDGTGAWGSITDSQTSAIDALSGPTADFHIWAAWQGGGDKVYVTLPLDDPIANSAAWGLTPSVLHPLNGDVNVHYGDNVEIAGGTITTGVSGLSRLTSSLFAPLTIISAPTATPSPIGKALLEGLRFFAGITGPQPACDPEPPRSLVETKGSALDPVVGLDRPLLKWCIKQNGGAARWRFSNNVAPVLNFDSRDARITGVDNLGDPLTSFAFRQIDPTFPRRQAYAPPGAIVNIELAQGTEDSPVTVTAANEVLAPAYMLRRVGNLLPSGTDIAVIWEVLSNCLFDPTDVSTQDALSGALRCAVNTFGEIGRPAAKKVFGSYLAGLDALISAGESVIVSLADPFSLVLSYSYPAPTGTPPSWQQGSGTDLGAESTPAGRYIVKVSDSSESWVLDNSGTLHPIPDGGTYICNAQVMKVRYNTPRPAVDAAPKGSNATCPGSGVQPRRFENVEISNVILRRSNGEAWRVSSAGLRARILSGEVFNCLTTHMLVWDQMTLGELNAVPQETLTVIPLCPTQGPLATAGL